MAWGEECIRLSIGSDSQLLFSRDEFTFALARVKQLVIKVFTSKFIVHVT